MDGVGVCDGREYDFWIFIYYYWTGLTEND
jgi:hypothetical protein